MEHVERKRSASPEVIPPSIHSPRTPSRAFPSDADVFVYYTGDDRVMGLLRRYSEQTLICLFNFSEHPAEVKLHGKAWKDILSGEETKASDDGTALIHFDGYGFRWLIEE